MDSDLQNALVNWFTAMENLSTTEQAATGAVSLAAARAMREERAKREDLYLTLRNVLEKLGRDAARCTDGTPAAPPISTVYQVSQPDPKRC